MTDILKLILGKEFHHHILNCDKKHCTSSHSDEFCISFLQGDKPQESISKLLVYLYKGKRISEKCKQLCKRMLDKLTSTIATTDILPLFVTELGSMPEETRSLSEIYKLLLPMCESKTTPRVEDSKINTEEIQWKINLHCRANTNTIRSNYEYNNIARDLKDSSYCAYQINFSSISPLNALSSEGSDAKPLLKLSSLSPPFSGNKTLVTNGNKSPVTTTIISDPYMIVPMNKSTELKSNLCSKSNALNSDAKVDMFKSDAKVDRLKSDIKVDKLNSDIKIDKLNSCTSSTSSSMSDVSASDKTISSANYKLWLKTLGSHKTYLRYPYLLAICPRSIYEAGDLYHLVISRGIKLMVSMFSSGEKCCCEFWRRDILPNIPMKNGVRLAMNEPEKILFKDSASGVTVTERIIDVNIANRPVGVSSCELMHTGIMNDSKDGEIENNDFNDNFNDNGFNDNKIIHIHYDNWKDNKPLPSLEALELLLDRIEEINLINDIAEFDLGCRYSRSRSSIVLTSHLIRYYIRVKIITGLEDEQCVDNIVINIPSIIYEFRLQRYEFLMRPEQLLYVYVLTAKFYARIKDIETQLKQLDIPDKTIINILGYYV